MGVSKCGRGAAASNGPGKGEGRPSIPEISGWLADAAALQPNVHPAVLLPIPKQPEISPVSASAKTRTPDDAPCPCGDAGKRLPAGAQA
jgi:hypothetical protein